MLHELLQNSLPLFFMDPIKVLEPSFQPRIKPKKFEFLEEPSLPGSRKKTKISFWYLNYTKIELKKRKKI